jgi:hypothetical protein
MHRTRPLLALLLILAWGTAAAAPYLVPNPALDGAVRITPLANSAEDIGGERLRALPSGIAVRRLADGRIELLVSHALAQADMQRALSRWTLAPDGLELRPAGVGVPARAWDRAAGDHATEPALLHRLGFVDLSPPGAFSDGKLGTEARLLITGETYDERRPADEQRLYGRLFAQALDDPDGVGPRELPSLGRQAWRGAQVNPLTQRLTVVMLLEHADAQTLPRALNTRGTPAPSELFVYVGRKTDMGDALERAGLDNGLLYGVRVLNGRRPLGAESDPHGLGDARTGWRERAPFDLRGFGRVATKTGRALQARAIAAGATRFQGLAGGAWDPRAGHEGDFYFITSGRSLAPGNAPALASRLWRLRFEDLSRPEIGGELTLLLRGDEGPRTLDALSVDRSGRILLLERPGTGVAGAWLYDIADGHLLRLAEQRPANLPVPAAQATAGHAPRAAITDAGDLLGAGWFLISAHGGVDARAPSHPGGGQILALYVEPGLGQAAEQ